MATLHRDDLVVEVPEIVRPDQIVHARAATPSARAKLSEPRQEALRLWLLLTEASDLTAEFLDWLDCEEKPTESWADYVAADLAGIPWLGSMLAGFVSVEMWPQAISEARDVLDLVGHESRDPDAYIVPAPTDFLADVFIHLEYVSSALTAFVERYESFEPADCCTDADQPRVAARFADDFRGGAWAIDAAVKCLPGEFMDAELTAARDRLRARLSRSPWLVAVEGGAE